MIGIVLSLGGDVAEVRIDGNSLTFRGNGSPNFATIEGLKLDKEGTLKEFPDLKDKENWKQIAIERFKEHFKKLETEREKVEYVINDLKKFGWVLEAIQKAGHRLQRIKQGGKNGSRRITL